MAHTCAQEKAFTQATKYTYTYTKGTITHAYLETKEEQNLHSVAFAFYPT